MATAVMELGNTDLCKKHFVVVSASREHRAPNVSHGAKFGCIKWFLCWFKCNARYVVLRVVQVASLTDYCKVGCTIRLKSSELQAWFHRGPHSLQHLTRNNQCNVDTVL